MLGVCLGHQAIGHVYGAASSRATELMHGKTSWIHHDGRGVFAGLPDPLEATRYHSLVVDRGRPARRASTITAETADGTIMGVRHRGPAARGRAVPPRVDPDDGWPRPAGQLPRRRAGALTAGAVRGLAGGGRPAGRRRRGRRRRGAGLADADRHRRTGGDLVAHARRLVDHHVGLRRAEGHVDVDHLRLEVGVLQCVPRRRLGAPTTFGTWTGVRPARDDEHHGRALVDLGAGRGSVRMTVPAATVSLASLCSRGDEAEAAQLVGRRHRGGVGDVRDRDLREAARDGELDDRVARRRGRGAGPARAPRRPGGPTRPRSPGTAPWPRRARP